MISIVQARLNSKRLPGKALKLINGKPMLFRVIESLKKSKQIKQIFIATSNSNGDKKIVKFCKKNKFDFFTGNLEDVSNRFKVFLEKNFNQHKSFVRINGDSPLIDHKLVDKCIKLFKKKKPNILTNVFPRTFPKGQSIEIINSNFFLKYQKKFKSTYDREHVTPFFYRKKLDKILNIKNKKNCSDLNMSVDTNEDLKKMRYLFRKLYQYKKNRPTNWKILIKYLYEKKN